jgi:hypothetical protein
LSSLFSFANIFFLQLRRHNNYISFVDLLLTRRHYLGDRGENEVDIQQSENELHGEMEITNQENEDNVQEEVNDEDEPPPLEDIDEPEIENENETIEPENKIIEPVTDTVAIEKPKEDDIGRF